MTTLECMKYGFESLCLVAHRATIKEEELYIGGEKYLISPGDFIRTLMDTTKQGLWNEIYEIAVSVRSICEEIELSSVSNLDNVITTVEILLEMINSILTLSSSPEFLKKMIRLLPAQ